MKLFNSLLMAALALTSYTSATPVDFSKRSEPISVQLTASNNSVVKVVVINNGETRLNLLTSATRVPFHGIRIHLDTNALSTDSFLVLEAGDKELKIEAAALYDLSSGGSFDVVANGVLPYANENSTELIGALRYDSNRFSISVDGTEAAATRKSLAKRNLIDSRCTHDQVNILRTALWNCQKLASGAATAAAAGDRRLQTFFKSSSTSVRDEVYHRMREVAQECGTTSSDTISYCAGHYGDCDNPGCVAFTSLEDSTTTYCPILFTYIEPLTTECKSFDHGTSILREMTHAPHVYSPVTLDFAYGYDSSVALSTDDALKNVDSYVLFANFVRLNCM